MISFPIIWFVVSLIIPIAISQPYEISSFNIRTQDPKQPVYHYTDCTVHYPTGTHNITFPLLIFSPGYFEDHRFYAYLWNTLVPLGYVVAVTSSYDLDLVSFPLWKARDQSFLLGYLKKLSQSDSSSPIYGLLNNKSAAAGHSEGGAASFISGAPVMLDNAYPDQFDAVVVESGCFPFFIDGYSYLSKAITNQTIPIFFITGTHDCLCPPKDWDSKLYHVSTSSCKYIANIVNGGHCEFCWDGLGNLDCKALVDSVGCIFKDVIGYQQQQTQTMRYLVPYLDWQLKGIEPQHRKLNSLLQQDIKRNLVQSEFTCQFPFARKIGKKIGVLTRFARAWFSFHFSNMKYVSYSYDPLLRWYMAQVYLTAFSGLIVCFFGAQLHLKGYLEAGFLWTLAQIITLVAVAIFQINKKQMTMPHLTKETIHYALMLSFSFSLGVNVGATMEYAIRASNLGGVVSVTHEVVTEALVLSLIIFGIFTVVGIFVPPGIFFLAACIVSVGGFIMSISLFMTLFGLTSLASFDVIYIQFGLVVSSCYIIVDTAIIMERAKYEDRSVITSAIVLLTDFIQVFLRILIILARSKARNGSSGGTDLPVFFNDEL